MAYKLLPMVENMKPQAVHNSLKFGIGKRCNGNLSHFHGSWYHKLWYDSSGQQ